MQVFASLIYALRGLTILVIREGQGRVGGLLKVKSSKICTLKKGTHHISQLQEVCTPISTEFENCSPCKSSALSWGVNRGRKLEPIKSFEVYKVSKWDRVIECYKQ